MSDHDARELFGDRPTLDDLAPRDHFCWLSVTEDEAVDLAAGYAPKTVQAMARMACETDDARCRRNAAKPLRPKARR